MEEDEQQFNMDSDEETHNAEDEPDQIIETDQMQADLNYQINEYQRTEHWSEYTWWRMCESH
jgi:hypothetical protein